MQTSINSYFQGKSSPKKQKTSEEDGEIKLPGPLTETSWYNKLESEFRKPYFKQLVEFVEEEQKNYTIYPPKDEIFTALNVCPLDKVKVVIVGQDPYHQPNQAHGLSFSVKVGVPPPPSLKNIYKELCEDIPGFKAPNHGYLLSWAQQGVLMLNSVLTVRESKPNSHKDKGWEDFTGAVISLISKECENVVFVLWGNYAKKRKKLIDTKKHLVLESGHPSPLSVKTFTGCRHFSKINAYLKECGKEEINWQLENV